ncbi:MAG: hypothetical protein IJG23_01615, partial [Clostridia bacterium]|nr:hypothetical protein [Clostridia bacterium]
MKLRIRQTIYILLAVAAFALLIWVVIHSQSPESLMTPPEAAGDYKDIQKVIEKTADDGIILKAPNEGEYTTAITFTDLNGDNENDAIAFYRIKNDDTSSIYMSVLLKSGTKWQASEAIKGKGNDILEFAYGDLNYDSIPEIVVGWQMFDSKDNNTLCVYTVGNKDGATKVKNCDSKIYTKMFVADVCDEGRDEILLIKNTFNDESIPADANVYEMEDDTLKSIGSASLLASVSEYKKFQMQSVDGVNVFYLDGVVDKTNMVTEILYWDKESAKLYNPTEGKSADEVLTFREGTVPASDINADGVIEIPFSEPNESEEYIHITEWKQFSFDKYTSIAEGICSDDLIFIFPEKWEGKIAANQKGKVWSFYDVSSDESVKLFDLVVSNLSDWQANSDKFDKLTIHYGTIYGVSISDSKSELALSKNEIE